MRDDDPGGRRWSIGSNCSLHPGRGPARARARQADLRWQRGQLAPVKGDPRLTIQGRHLRPRGGDAMHGCDWALNFAAETHVDRSIVDPGAFVRTDVEGTYTLLEAARELGVARFVQISTDEPTAPRPDGTSRPSLETNALKPSSPYAAKGRLRLLLLGYLWPARRRHALLEQLRLLPIPREAAPALHQQRARRPPAARLRLRAQHPRLDLRLRPLRRARRHPGRPSRRGGGRGLQHRRHRGAQHPRERRGCA